MSFLILTLPRSRSAWLSHFLNYPPRIVGHDIIVECKDIREFVVAFSTGMYGTVETGGMLGWKLYKKLLPAVKIITIHRPIEEVSQSFKKIGLSIEIEDLEKANDLLNLCAEIPGAKSYCFADLDRMEVCRELFEYCLDLPFDYDWYEELSKLNIQIDMRARIQQIVENQHSLAFLKQQVNEMSAKELAPWLT